MGGIENRKLLWILGGLLLLITAAFGWSLTRGYGEKKEEVQEDRQADAKASDPAKTACASNATYARLKEVAFEEAMRSRSGDTASLDTLAAHSVARMENPVMLSRDEDLNVTVCSGKFILEVPPGAEAALGGQRRLTADIEYSAQAAADGSGLVYQVRGAEPIINKLAAFNLRGQPLQLPPGAQPQAETEYAEAAPVATPEPVQAPTPPPAPREPAPPPEPRRAEAPPRPAPPPRPRPEPTPERREEAPTRRAEAEPARRTFSNPSFSCRSARTRGEKMVCGSTSLAARDRAMSSMFYSALASADSRRRAELRRTRDRFLAYRDRCPDDACVAEAYQGRMSEIRDIMEAE